MITCVHSFYNHYPHIKKSFLQFCRVNCNNTHKWFTRDLANITIILNDVVNNSSNNHSNITWKFTEMNNVNTSKKNVSAINNFNKFDKIDIMLATFINI
jgi:hypothetical protein